MADKGSEKAKTEVGSTAEGLESSSERGLIRFREGVVVSNKMMRTVVVQVTSQMKHKKYGKYIKRHRKFFAHDESNQCQIGDRVKISETRPMSKNKRWRVQEVIARASA